uniref:Uncharacterized protein n=1 Tax=Anguilla anguilla TaxID=7936 RepID=A0A0E9X3S9_ANGAN
MRVQKETSQKMAYSVPYIHYSRHQHVKAENKPVLGYINYSLLSDSHTNPRKHSCSPPCWSAGLITLRPVYTVSPDQHCDQ